MRALVWMAGTNSSLALALAVRCDQVGVSLGFGEHSSAVHFPVEIAIKTVCYGREGDDGHVLAVVSSK